MHSLVLLAAVSAAFGVPLDEPKKFTDYRLISAEAITAECFRAAEELEGRGIVDLWSHGAPEKGTILFSVAPENYDEVKSTFARFGTKLNILERDLQKLIEKDQIGSTYSAYASDRPFSFNQFETYEQIVASLNYYNKSNLLPVINVFSIGQTVEKREIYGVRISNSTANKSVIFIECGIHAREWASTSTCLFIIDRLIRFPKVHKALLDKYEFHIVPSSNPDGYVYTHTSNRLWRKNRSRQARGCFGVDLNRNFRAGPHCGVGTSQDSCSDIFCGTAPFSEPETAALERYISKLHSRIDYYVSLHSFGLMWMFPYSHTHDKCPDHADLLRRAKIGVDHIANNFGSKYVYGPIATTIYDVTGSSIDWAYMTQNITKSFVLELQPGLDFQWGGRGFLLDKSRIIPTGLETLGGLKAMWLS
ncbi:carboxypeptidase B [Galendromus occidentalis]|uniref:Carboxypeptidase B n=1 Tax=Galendromus occidentalis TaxID=34638 RepID=A0AAJ6QS21_9ACAR|nr:carboxypeptidase B [Galendromus occidentalis]